MINTHIQPERSPEKAKAVPDSTQEAVAHSLQAQRGMNRQLLDSYIQEGADAMREAEPRGVTEEPQRTHRRNERIVAHPESTQTVGPIRSTHARISLPGEQPNESLSEGAWDAAIGTAAVSGIMGSSATSIALSAFPYASSSSILALSAGVPAATGLAGYYIGKRMGHPATGALSGTALGAVGAMAYSSFNVGALPAVASAFATAAVASTAASMAFAGGVGGAVYGLGRWHESVWKSKPSGILGTLARGVISPVSIPLGYARKKLEAVPQN